MPKSREFIGRLGTKFTVLKKIGYGGTCRVVLATENETLKKVAIKLPRYSMKGQEFLQFLKTEVDAMCEFDHPNVL